MLGLLFSLFLQPDASARVTDAADSVMARRDAARAQLTFEGQRRQRLPVSWGSGGRCDVRVGRFCYWYDESLPRGPEEPATIAPLRAQLIERLDAAAAAIPGDRWVVGQRVRYLVEAGRFDDALDAARECRADRWWCQALAGFTRHVAGDYSGAGQAFTDALDAMADNERCAWEDIADLLADRTSRTWQRLTCEARRERATLAWYLADPLWSAPGNDRETEHYARHVMSQLERDSRSPYHLSWGADTHELLIRYGWPERWSRRPASGFDPGAVHVTGHEPSPAFQFFPDDSGLAAPAHVTASAWQLRSPEARNRYAPSWLAATLPLPAQVARFARGDSMLIVTAFESPIDTAFEARTAMWAIASLDSLGHIEVHALPGAGVQARHLSATARWLSIEGRDTQHRSLARLRTSLPAPTEPGLLLYRDPTPTDAALDDVIGRALPSMEIARDQPLGLYWEYATGRSARDSVTHVISVYPRSAGWLTRLARTMRLAEAAAPVHLTLAEPIASGGVPRRAIALDLSRLAPGTYDLRVRASVGDAPDGIVTRTIRVR